MTVERRIGDWIANRYEIYDIHVGGMGVVFVVYDHQGSAGQRVLALKTLRDEFLYDAKQIGRFTTECHTWVKLERHPNIVRAYSVQEIEDKPYAVLELVTGGDLRRWIGTPRLDVPQILRFGIQFCLGMEHAAAKGLHCHRDIKPENLLISEGGTLKVTDFGLAKVRDEVRVLGAPSSGPIPLDEFDDVDDEYRVPTGLEDRPTSRRATELDIPLPVDPDDLVPIGTETVDQGRVPVPEPLPRPSPAGPANENGTSGMGTIDWPKGGLAGGQPGAVGQRANIPARPSFDTVDHQSPRTVDQLSQRIDTSARGITRAGAMLGTGPYMPPEQFVDAKAVDFRADIYSFGIVMFEMITGSRPFTGTTYAKLARQHAQTKPPSITRFIPRKHSRVAKVLDEVVQRCLEKDPEKRFPTYLDLRRILSKCLWVVAREKMLAPTQTEMEAWELTGKGVSLGTLGRFTEERASYEASSEIKPDYVPTWFNQAAALGSLGHLDEAIEYANIALHLNPSSVPALINKGLALHAMRRPEEAIGFFDAAVHIQPRDPEVWYGRGIVLLSQRNFQGAKSALEQALRLRPMFVEAHSALNAAINQTIPWTDEDPSAQRAKNGGREQLTRQQAIPWVRRTEDTTIEQAAETE